MPLIIRAAPIRLLVSFLLRFVQGVIPGVQIYITARLIDEATKWFAGSTSSSQVWVFLVMQAALLLISSILRSWDGLITLRFQQQVTYTIQHKIVEKASRLPLSFYDQSDSYDRLQRASSEQNGLEMATFCYNLVKVC